MKAEKGSIIAVSIPTIGVKWNDSSTPRPGRFTPWERAAVPITDKPEWVSELVWTSVDNRKLLAPHVG